MALTDVQVRAAKPREKVYRLFDGDGLYLEVTPGGSKLWRLKFRIHRRERRIAFGPYPDVSLSDARQRCQEARRLVRRGVDPVRDRKAKREAAAEAASHTLRAVGARWLADTAVKKGWTEAYRLDVDGALERHIYPRLGDRPLREITARDLLGVLNAKSTQLETVRRLRQRLDGIFSYAVVYGLTDSNPAHDIRREFSAPKVTPMPAIPEHELPELLARVAADGNRVIEAAIWLLCLCAVRTGELRRAEWTEFDFEQRLWTIPAARMKKRVEHNVPLSRQAVTILERLREVTGGARFLFPHRSDLNQCMSENTILFTLYRCGYRGRMSGHGFRSVFSTSCNEHQKNPDVVEATLSHVHGNKVRRAYNRTAYLLQRRELLQWWADRVDSLTEQRSATVLQFPTSASA